MVSFARLPTRPSCPVVRAPTGSQFNCRNGDACKGLAVIEGGARRAAQRAITHPAPARAATPSAEGTLPRATDSQPPATPATSRRMARAWLSVRPKRSAYTRSASTSSAGLVAPPTLVTSCTERSGSGLMSKPGASLQPEPRRRKPWLRRWSSVLWRATENAMRRHSWRRSSTAAELCSGMTSASSM